MAKKYYNYLVSKIVIAVIAILAAISVHAGIAYASNYTGIIDTITAYAATTGVSNPSTVTSFDVYQYKSYTETKLSYYVQIRYIDSSNTKYYIYKRVNGGNWQLFSSSGRYYTTDYDVALGNSYSYALGSADGTTIYDNSAVSFMLFESVDISSIQATSNGIELTWNVASNALGYEIYRSVGNGDYSYLSNVYDGTTNSYIDSNGLKNNVKYSYYVIPVHGDYKGLLYSSNSVIYTKKTALKYTVKYKQKEARSQLKLINNFRTGKNAWARTVSGSKEYYKNLSKLKYDYDLEKAAMQRAAELVVSFSHQRPDGTTCFTAIEKALRGKSYSAMGENILYASYSISSKKAFNLWAETNEPYSGQGHRRNMLSGNYNAVGIACCSYKGYTFWVQNFGYIDNINTTKTKANNKDTIITTDVSKSTLKAYKKRINSLGITINKNMPGTSNITEAIVAGKKVNLSWTKVSGAEGYYVYVATKKSGTYKKMLTVKSGSKLKGTVKKLKSGKRYFIKVVAYDKTKGKVTEGNASNIIEIKTE